MATVRKAADVRLKELNLAMRRIQIGRSRTGAKKLSILAIAKEAGVTDSLIHNHYPGFVEKVAVAMGKAIRDQRDAKLSELKIERQKSKELRADLKKANGCIAKLASINETLSFTNRLLEARLSSYNVVSFSKAS